MVRGMVSGPVQPKAGAFVVGCWLLGLMAFCQILVAGMALATRFDESRVEKVKEVLTPIVVRVPSESAPATASGKKSSLVQNEYFSKNPEPVEPEREIPTVPPTPLEIPRIADARAERLVEESRQKRVAGDMGQAILKLDEALAIAPDDPVVHYELGLTHEQMGVFDTASKHYEEVFKLGTTGAGSLYEVAARKLRDGFGQENEMLGKLSLGRIKIFNNPKHKGGQLVILTIPVQKDPKEEIDSRELQISVNFFNKTTKGEIVPLQPDEESWAKDRDHWISLPFDWAGDEETVQMSYTIPNQEDIATAHLFGDLTYYGQVVSLIYKGEVLDVQAWPRDLAARISRPPAASGISEGNPSDGVLPDLQNEPPPEDLNEPLVPPLPE